MEPKRFLVRYNQAGTSQRTDSREQIIEEQIEEYKKKREKVLGNQSPATLIANAKEVQPQKEVSTQKEVPTQKEIPTQKEVPMQKKVPTQEEVPVPVKLESIEISDDDKTEETEKTDEDQEKVDASTDEYASRLSKLKQKWEEARRKKISSQKKDLNESYNEENLERLAKVLGNNNTNLKVIEILLYFLNFFFSHSEA